MIAVLDYDAGNLASVACAVRHLGHEPEITRDPDVVRSAERVIFPGVGAAGFSRAILPAGTSSLEPGVVSRMDVIRALNFLELKEPKMLKKEVKTYESVGIFFGSVAREVARKSWRAPLSEALL